MPILIFISLFTLLDFVLLFSIGSQIGLLTTLLLVLGTGFAGLHLIRKEGVSTLARARQRMQAGELPSSELFTGAALIFGGALLMAPGFLSDALGLACLIPSARQLMLKALTWVGLKSAMGKQTHSAFTRSDPPFEEPIRDTTTQNPNAQHTANSDATQNHDTTPIEGDFISRDDSIRR